MESDTRPPLKPMTAKREQILEAAFVQLRKARERVGPSVLNKLRRMIAGSPELMDNLGVNSDLKPKSEKTAEPPPQTKISARAEIEDKIDISEDEVSRASRREIIKERERVLQKMKAEEEKQKKAKKTLPKKVVPPQEEAGYEKVDQAKNMEVLAKLMELHPKGRDMVKSALKKASDK